MVNSDFILFQIDYSFLTCLLVTNPSLFMMTHPALFLTLYPLPALEKGELRKLRRQEPLKTTLAQMDQEKRPNGE